MFSKGNNPFQQPPIPKGVIEQAILQSSSMTSASQKVGCSYNTFKKWAKAYGVWNPNQSGRGISKNKPFKPLYDNVSAESIDKIKNIFGAINDD